MAASLLPSERNAVAAAISSALAEARVRHAAVRAQYERDRPERERQIREIIDAWVISCCAALPVRIRDGAESPKAETEGETRFSATAFRMFAYAHKTEKNYACKIGVKAEHDALVALSLALTGPWVELRITTQLDGPDRAVVVAWNWDA